jgi:hypothetical protein
MSAIIYTGTPTTVQNLVPTASLTTLERLLMWCSLLFFRLNGNKDVPLIEGNTVKQSSYQRFLGADGTLYLGFTHFVAVSSDLDVTTARPWTMAIEQNTAVGNTNYNS